jgi:hypothetical protein
MINSDKKTNLPAHQVEHQVHKLDYDSEYTITIARSIQEVEKTRNLWEEIPPTHPIGDIDYFLTEVSLRKEFVRPHVIVLRRDGIPEAMLIGRIEDVQLQYTIANKVLFTLTVRSLIIDEGGIQGNPSHGAALISEVIKCLRRREAEIASFVAIPTDSPIYEFGRTVPNFLIRDHLPIESLHYKLTLPASIDDFFKARSKKKRTRLRSLLKRLEKRYPGNVAIKIFKEKEQIEQLSRDIEEISKKTYQYGYGHGFVNNLDTHKLLTLLTKRGWLRVYILYVEDHPCAFWCGFIYKNTLFDGPGGTGFDPKYKNYEVGTILMLKMIEDLCHDPCVQYINFGIGDQLYKSRFCDISWEEANFFIFQPTLKGIILNAMRLLSGGSRRMGNILLTHLKLTEKWDKFTRARMTLKPEETE